MRERKQHGSERCGWGEEDAFTCHSCERTTCFCKGHDSDKEVCCELYCDDCCPCNDLEKQGDE